MTTAERAAQINELVEGWTRRGAEADVLTALDQTPVGELDALLGIVDLTALVRSLDDRRFGPDHRTRLLDLLCRSRRAELSLERLADLVHVLHVGLTPRSHQLAVRDVVLALRGDDLALFKSLLNSHGDYHDLEHLVFDDIDGELREQILAHVAEQAKGGPSPDLKILCDIDDTVVSMLHDNRFPRGTVYPGVEAFLRQLDHGAAADPGSPGDLTFITARPTDPRGMVETYTLNGLSELDLPPHTVMTGSITNLVTKGRIAERKLENFDRYRQLFPECQVVFIGDSGQADVQVGQAMLQRDPDHVRAVLVHDVAQTPPEERERRAAHGIYFFDTYAGAAAWALQLGLISARGAQRIAEDVGAGLGRLALTPDQRETVGAQLAAELAQLAQASENAEL